MNGQELDEFKAMIPAYVNGSLNAADSKRLKSALSASAELRDSLKNEELLKERIRGGLENMMEEADQNSEQRLAALLKDDVEIHAPSSGEQVAAHAISPDKSEGDKFKNILALLNPRRWHPAIALSLALAIPAQAAVIASQGSTIAALEKENFQLASGPCAKDAGKNAILMEFKDSAQWSDVSDLLTKEKLAIATHGDFGTLTVRSTSEGTALAKQIERLRASPLVTSAEKSN